MAAAVLGLVEQLHRELEPIGHTAAQQYHACLVAEGAHIDSVTVGALDARVVGAMPVVAGQLLAQPVPHHQHVE